MLPSAFCNSTVNMFSTSSPTYPACVKVVASAIANGTPRNFARLFAIYVFPDPVGPINRILDFSILISGFGFISRL